VTGACNIKLKLKLKFFEKKTSFDLIKFQIIESLKKIKIPTFKHLCITFLDTFEMFRFFFFNLFLKCKKENLYSNWLILWDKGTDLVQKGIIHLLEFAFCRLMPPVMTSVVDQSASLTVPTPDYYSLPFGGQKGAGGSTFQSLPSNSDGLVIRTARAFFPSGSN
jgi:hypothetical protein